VAAHAKYELPDACPRQEADSQNQFAWNMGAHDK
jgi:hypothetical protein